MPGDGLTLPAAHPRAPQGVVRESHYLRVAESAHVPGVPATCDVAHHLAREGPHEVGHHERAAPRVALRCAAREALPRRREAEPGPEPPPLLTHRGRNIGDPTPTRVALRGVRLGSNPSAVPPECTGDCARWPLPTLRAPAVVDGDEPSSPEPRLAGDESRLPRFLGSAPARRDTRAQSRVRPQTPPGLRLQHFRAPWGTITAPRPLVSTVRDRGGGRGRALATRTTPGR